MARKSVTSFDVARCAAVSRSTVSRVFTADSSVDPQTRQRVIECASRLGYRPNGAARALATSKSRTVGIVFYELDYLTEASFGRVVTGAAKALSYGGYNLHFCCSNPASPLSTRQHFLENAREGMLDGAIVMDCAVADEDILQLDRLGVPFILVDREIRGREDRSVWNDHFGGAFLIAHHLVDQGVQHLAFVSQAPPHMREMRLQGVVHAGGRCSVQDINLPAGNVDAIIDSQFPALLASSNRPDAILCDSAVATIRLLFLALRLGLRVPEDLAIASFEDDPILSASHPEVTAARVHWEAAGEIAGSALARILEGEAADVPGRPLPVSLVVRGSSDRTHTAGAPTIAARPALEIQEVLIEREGGVPSRTRSGS